MTEGGSVVPPFWGDGMLKISEGHSDTGELQSNLKCCSVRTGIDKMGSILINTNGNYIKCN